jgi:3-hydroxyisobutyrate dehydrogenase
VWNRTSDKASALLNAGAQWASTPKVLAESVDTVITLLTNEAAIDDVYSGTEGLLSCAGAHPTFIDMSTVNPAKPPELALRVQAVGAAYLECPVGGSIGPAKEGKLLGFVGGHAADLSKVQSLLEHLCKRVEHVGTYGAGSTMKMAVNLPLMVYWQTLGEALSLIDHLKLDPQRVVDILSESSGGPNMLKVRGPLLVQALGHQKNDTVTVDVATMRKDMRTMLALAQTNHRELPLTSMALQKFNEAADFGLDGKDCTQLPVWWLGQGAHSK